MKKFLSAVLAAVYLLSFPQLSVSEIKEGSIEISPFAGYYFLHERDRAGFGLRGGYNFTKNWGLEGAYDYAGSRAAFLHADLLYHLTPEKAFTPFIFAGAGNAHIKPGDGSYNHILGEIGAGFKYSLSDNIAIRVDVRDIQEKYNNVATTAGLVFAFGGKTPKYAETAVPEMKPERKSGPKTDKTEEKVITHVAEPKVEEKVIIHVAEPKKKIIIFALEDVHFDFDKSTLTKEAQVILKRNILVLKKNPKADVRIAGYTSASGTKDYNQKLSERRANAVKDYLIQEGVAKPDRFSEIGYGEENPEEYEAAPRDLYSEEAKANMRVLFEIILK
ncbi:MAG: OmpA family protein [Nitrospinae bacterium]|nr:OmpA family protein [Nitrospinota bacterium]